jgi:hypothetical protein
VLRVAQKCLEAIANGNLAAAAKYAADIAADKHDIFADKRNIHADGKDLKHDGIKLPTGPGDFYRRARRRTRARLSLSEQAGRYFASGRLHAVTQQKLRGNRVEFRPLRVECLTSRACAGALTGSREPR